MGFVPSKMSCTTCLCPPMDNSRSGSSIQSPELRCSRAGPMWTALLRGNLYTRHYAHSAHCSLVPANMTTFLHQTPFSLAPCVASGGGHAAPDRATAGKSVNDVSSFWRGKMSLNIFCGPVYQPRRIFVLQVTGSFSQVSKVRGNKSVSYK